MKYQRGWLGVAVVGLIACSRSTGADWAKQAQAVLNSPQKLAVTPVQQGPRAGEPVEFKIQLQNGKSQPATMSSNTKVDIQLLGKNNEVMQKATCQIEARTSDAKCSIEAPESGVYKVKAAASDKDLLEDNSFLLVRPKAPAQKKAPAKARRQPEKTEEPTRNQQGCTASHGHANVAVTINEGSEAGGAFRAGVQSATIQALFEADDGGSAPAPIYIWLSPDHGNPDHNPLVIPSCGIASNEGHLGLGYAGVSSIAYTITPTIYNVPAHASLRAAFVPIVGIGVIPPPPNPQILSLIDRGPMAVEFFDWQGYSVKNDVMRSVSFVSNNSSVVGPRDSVVNVEPGALSADTLLLPYRIGTGTVFVSSQGLKTATHDVQVIGWAVIAVCLCGGLIGGIVLYLTSKGSIFARVFVGEAGAIVLSWAYVFMLLPKVDSTVAHNYITVLVVSLIGGYMGIKAIDLVIKRFSS